MPIFDGSRYNNAPVLRVKDADGKTRPTLYLMVAPLPYRMAYRTYVVSEGETLPLIANRLFNDPTQWWRIADINPEHLYPDNLPVGAVIRLPL